MAYIYKRGNKWAYRAYAGKDPITGKDKQVSKSGFHTKKDAQLAASIVERQLHQGDYIEPSPVTFKELINEWEKHYRVNAKISSVEARKRALNRVIDKFGHRAIQSITKQEYQSFIDELGEELSYNYISNIHVSANMVFEYALSVNLIKSIPSEKIKLPRKKKTIEDIEVEKTQVKFFEKDELEEFLLLAKNEGLQGDLVMFTTLAYTGLRIGELLALKWSDVDFDNQTLRVIKTNYNPNNNKRKYKLLPPKTDKSIRTIAIDKVVTDLLLKHKKEQEQIKKENAPIYRDENFIFTSDDGYPKVNKAVSLRMERLLDKMNQGKEDHEKIHLTLHSFRHTHTSLLIEANVHIKEIQERLGHSDISTTMDIYAHMTEDIKKEASTRFSNLMKNLSKNIYDKT